MLSPPTRRSCEHHGLNRVTDTCIPEEEAMRKIEHHMLELWKNADKKGERFFPHEFFYQLLRSKKLEKDYQIDPEGLVAPGRGREEPADLRARLGGLDARQHVRRGGRARRRQEPAA